MMIFFHKFDTFDEDPLFEMEKVFKNLFSVGVFMADRWYFHGNV